MIIARIAAFDKHRRMVIAKDSFSSPEASGTRAASRVEKLINLGVPFTPKVRAVCATHSPAGEVAVLGAALLQAPIEVGDRLPEAVRDIQTEVVVSQATLDTIIKCASGSFVKLWKASTIEHDGHQFFMARIWASSDPVLQDDVAYIAPGLAYNVGLSLHLWPLLEGTPFARGINKMEFVNIVPYQPPELSAIERCSLVPCAGGSSAQVYMATDVTIALIGVPIQDPLSTAGLEEEEPSAAADSLGQTAHASSTTGGLLNSSNSKSMGKGKSKPIDDDDLIDPTDDAVAALTHHFAVGKRLLSQGDIFAIEVNKHMLTAALAPHFSPSFLADEKESEEDAHRTIKATDVMYFKVEKLECPGGRGPAVIDADAGTRVTFYGHASDGIPAGLARYVTGAILKPEKTILPFSWTTLAALIASTMHPATENVGLRLALLLHGPPGSGKRAAAEAASEAIGCHFIACSCHELNFEGLPEKKVVEGLRTIFQVGQDYRPAILFLEHLNALSLGMQHNTEAFAARLANTLTDCITTFSESDGGHSRWSPFILVASANSADDIPAPLRRCFTHELHFEPPPQSERQYALEQGFQHIGTDIDSDVWDDIARQTAGLLSRDLRAVVADACAFVAQEGEDDEVALLEANHVHRAVDAVRHRVATELGAPKIPDVRWEDVGGLEEIKQSILDTVELPLKHPALFSSGLRRRSGVLLYGPPGTGKTLLAKAVATECSINFMSVKGPELINMYVGESERQIREVFAKARRARPCVIFFDELDSLAPARGKGSDSGGVMDRVVSQLLAEIDGVQGGGGTGDVFIIGATNRPDLLDPALLRPGRLDKLLYVGIASDVASRLKVIVALTRKFKMSEDVDLHLTAEKCASRMTGADLYALCSDAWMTAFKRTIEGNSAIDEDVIVSQSDFEIALASLRPSLSEQEVQSYEAIRNQHQSST